MDLEKQIRKEISTGTGRTFNKSFEKDIRKEISENVSKLYLLRESNKEFTPGQSKIHYSGRVYDEKEIQAMVDSVLDFWLTLGEKGEKFVDEFLAYTNMKYGLVVNSGSSANLLAVSALCSNNIENHLKPGDEVITSAAAFPTTVNPIIQNGLVPVFIDVNEGTYNVDVGRLSEAKSDKTRAIMFAHTLGNPAQIDTIMDFAGENNLYVIEDTCDALDSYYDKKMCGTFGDISTFSFYAAHHITMGEGGAILTNDSILYRQALSLRDWGRACYCKTGEINSMGACGHRFDHKYDGLPDGYDHKYVYNNIGYNLKPLDIQCAMGIEQLKKLPEFSIKRKSNFNFIYNSLKKYEDYFILPRALDRAEPSWFAFPLTIRNKAPFSRKDIVTFLEENQIETRMLFAGNIIKHPGYKNVNYRICGALSNTEKILKDTFFIGIFPGLTKEMLEYVVSIFDDFFNNLK